MTVSQNAKPYMERKNINEFVPVRVPSSSVNLRKAIKSVKSDKYSFVVDVDRTEELREGSAKDFPWTPTSFQSEEVNS